MKDKIAIEQKLRLLKNKWRYFPKTKADIDRLGMSLAKLAEEDPTFQVKTDEASGQTIISGMGELHLDIIVDRLKQELTQKSSSHNDDLRKEREVQTILSTIIISVVYYVF